MVTNLLRLTGFLPGGGLTGRLNRMGGANTVVWKEWWSAPPPVPLPCQLHFHCASQQPGDVTTKQLLPTTTTNSFVVSGSRFVLEERK